MERYKTPIKKSPWVDRVFMTMSRLYPRGKLVTRREVVGDMVSLRFGEDEFSSTILWVNNSKCITR